MLFFLSCYPFVRCYATIERTPRTRPSHGSRRTCFFYPFTPRCSRGQDDPSAWRCLNAEIDKVERRSVLDRARVCTELLNTSFTMILKGK